jgi:DNA-3-methyladenine glycosylase II
MTELQSARTHLRNADPVLARIIDERPDFDPWAWMAELPAMDLFGALLFQIVGQQLSVAATRRTLARIEALFDGHLPAPGELLTLDPTRLREAGLSWRRGRHLAGSGRAVVRDGRLNADVLSALPDEEFIAALTAVPGIGPWTAQGALLIALRRADVVFFPATSHCAQAVQRAYALDHLPTQQEVLDIAEKWRVPYRSLRDDLPLRGVLPAEPSYERLSRRSPHARGRWAVLGPADRLRCHAAGRTERVRATARSRHRDRRAPRGGWTAGSTTSTRPSTTARMS